MADFESFDDWYELTPEGDHNIWWDIPGTEFQTASEREETFQAFYTGFVDRDISPDERHDARLEFADLMGMVTDEDGNIPDFPWAEWAEWMGYEGS
jgi:hypothetical protein